MHDRIFYIVLTKGIPLRISGSGGRAGTTASVDSELTLLYRKLVGTRIPIVGPLPNPYFGSVGRPRPIADCSRMPIRTSISSRAWTDLPRRTRSRSSTEAPRRSPTGDFVLDSKGRASSKGKLSRNSRTLAESDGRRSGRRRPQRACLPRVNARQRARKAETSSAMRPGGRTIRRSERDGSDSDSSPARWRRCSSVPERARSNRHRIPGNPARRRISGRRTEALRSLSLQISYREGVTGVAGYVGEPFLDGTIRPDILFPAYVERAQSD